MLSFTAEEIWKVLGKTGKQEESVFLAQWPEVDEKLLQIELEKKWDKLLLVRKDVLKALEIQRKDGLIGNALQAQVDLHTADKFLYDYLSQNKEKLEMLFIVSKVNIFLDKKQSYEENAFQGEEVPELYVIIKVAPGLKCERCWNYSETVGKDNRYPNVCARCISVLDIESNN